MGVGSRGATAEIRSWVNLGLQKLTTRWDILGKDLIRETGHRAGVRRPGSGRQVSIQGAGEGEHGAGALVPGDGEPHGTPMPQSTSQQWEP